MVPAYARGISLRPVVLYLKLRHGDNYLILVIAGKSMRDDIFHRPKLALELARRLLRPSALDTQVRSGLFISGPRQTGKSTFLVQDLIPILESSGAITIYVDLWKAAGRTPGEKLTLAVGQKLALLQEKQPRSFISRAKQLIGKMGLSSAEVEASVELPSNAVAGKIKGTLKFDFDPSKVGSAEGISLAEALLTLSTRTQRDIVFIVDEVQDMRGDGEGQLILQELKATRDAINNRPADHGYFLFVGNGSHRSMIHEMTAQRKQAFYGADSINYPELGDDYVQHVLDRAIEENESVTLPSTAAACKGFRILGRRPDALKKALQTLQTVVAQQSNRPASRRAVDMTLDGIVNTMHDEQGNIEFEKLRLLGDLPQVVFARICRGPEEGVSGLYSGDALEDYANALQWEDVTTREVQNALGKLQSSNLVLRDGDSGPYRVTDPFLRESWLRRHRGTDGTVIHRGKGK